MRESSVNRARLAAGVAMLAILSAAMALARGAPPAAIASTQGASRSLDRLIDAVLRQGPASQLPAHLSVVLGVSAVEQPTAVKQAVMREAETVRTFNVCTGNHNDVVMITYNERSRSSKAYLMPPDGKLRKAVSFQAGAPAVERSLNEARSDFAAEIKFWMDVGRQPAAAK
ncbi:MAG: hypothetical protein ACYDAH_10240 [Steroidobacteraceae bacterium]